MLRQCKMFQEKWQVHEERNRLNAEKLAFKEDRKAIVEAIERERLEVDRARVSKNREMGLELGVFRASSFVSSMIYSCASSARGISSTRNEQHSSSNEMGMSPG